MGEAVRHLGDSGCEVSGFGFCCLCPLKKRSWSPVKLLASPSKNLQKLPFALFFFLNPKKRRAPHPKPNTQPPRRARSFALFCARQTAKPRNRSNRRFFRRLHPNLSAHELQAVQLLAPALARSSGIQRAGETNRLELAGRPGYGRLKPSPRIGPTGSLSHGLNGLTVWKDAIAKDPLALGSRKSGIHLNDRFSGGSNS